MPNKKGTKTRLLNGKTATVSYLQYNRRLNSSPQFFHACSSLSIKYMHEKMVEFNSNIYGIN